MEPGQTMGIIRIRRFLDVHAPKGDLVRYAAVRQPDPFIGRADFQGIQHLAHGRIQGPCLFFRAQEAEAVQFFPVPEEIPVRYLPFFQLPDMEPVPAGKGAHF